MGFLALYEAFEVVEGVREFASLNMATYVTVLIYVQCLVISELEENAKANLNKLEKKNELLEVGGKEAEI